MENTTDTVANALYESECIKFGSFKIKSGAQSPYYIDMARLLSKPKKLCAIAEVAAEKIHQITVTDQLTKLASIELKGALIAPSIACKINLPCAIVRKEEKTYGTIGRIAGATITKEDKILFVDDVVSEGLSKIEGIKPLKEVGAEVKHILVIVNREQGGKETLEKIGYTVHALAKISEIVIALQKNGKISAEQAKTVLDYIKK
ncbi:MAG: orotate phosphoribosyltransferase [Candidatus Bathyarchaeota archaeon]|uniref:orotate phosphoribosyltransferase n=1 Tax=Candidatus Bathycorpusculum sp. TaxID=2994959 RepID=UPI0028294D86|nr:orotate phosphoribosyltransferase [Candidatus Termiticorpusculum sp.]MCL2257879.1 orotate phosphoribosyltransferase [Candidatus Termiticorpusculum sp.]MCL2292001.1 orotate phosphoribosyltransferase [Candidatus Termiticorpusculum sp.]